MTYPKYAISPAGEKWIAAKIKAFRATHMREPNLSETFSIKQAWRALQIDVQLRKQTRRLHKKSAASENFQWQPCVAPGVNPE
jgi:hypothetical protein